MGDNISEDNIYTSIAEVTQRIWAQAASSTENPRADEVEGKI